LGYALVFRIASGSVFGSSTPVILSLLGVPSVLSRLEGVAMELEDCAFPLVDKIIATADPKEAFTGVDVALLLGSFPRKPGMERKELLHKNAIIFKDQGKYLNDYASNRVKVLVVGNPANTNCLIAMENAPNIPRENFTALTRLDHNRAKAQIAKKLNVPVNDVKNIIIWGNHSSTQYPDINHAVIRNSNVRTAINNDTWIDKEFVPLIQQRGAAVLAKRKLSSAASAATAIIDHMRDWLIGSKGEIVSMGVVSDGSYDTPQGLIYSFPVTTKHGIWSIVKGLSIDSRSRHLMNVTAEELIEERNAASEFLPPQKIR